MNLTPISATVEDVLLHRLTDTVTGLVPTAAAMAKAANVQFPQIDLTGDSEQLFRAQISLADYLNTGDPIFPAVFVYIVQSVDQHTLTSYDFSGQVNAGIDIFLSSDTTELPTDLHRLSNIFADALYHVFGIPYAAMFEAAGIGFNGGLRVVRNRPISNQGENWVQSVSASIPFTVSLV